MGHILETNFPKALKRETEKDRIRMGSAICALRCVIRYWVLTAMTQREILDTGFIPWNTKISLVNKKIMM